MRVSTDITITPPNEVTLQVTKGAAPTISLTATPLPEVVTSYAIGPQGPPGPTVPPNALPTATGPLNLGGNRLTGLAAPSTGTDAVNSSYLDSRFTYLVDELKPGPITQTKASVTENFSLVTGFNGMSVGPVTINLGKTVTIPTGSTWVIL